MNKQSIFDYDQGIKVIENIKAFLDDNISVYELYVEVQSCLQFLKYNDIDLDMDYDIIKDFSEKTESAWMGKTKSNLYPFTEEELKIYFSGFLKGAGYTKEDGNKKVH